MSSTAPMLDVAGPEVSHRVEEASRLRFWPITVWTTTAVWSAVLFVVVRDAYTGFRLGRFDLGNMVQAVWSTANGRFLETTEGSTGEQMSRLGSHADPFLAALAPLWALWPSPLALALAQIVVVALGALPVFWLARRHLDSERVAGLLALAYLAYPWIATSAVGAIHPVTFAITFLLFCVWFLDTDRLLPFLAFALLTFSTGELMGLPVVALGVWYAWARGRRRAGSAIAALGAAWTFVAIYVVVPKASGGDSSFYGFYDHVGGSPQGVVRTLLTDPLAVLGALVEAHDIVYLVWLGVPLLFLFVLSPGLAAVALPQLLANTMSDFRSMSDPRYHSVAAIVPFLVAATVFAVSKMSSGRREVAAAAVLTCSACIALVVGPWPRAVGMSPLGGRESVSKPRRSALAHAVALVPGDAPVVASNSVGAHLSGRRVVYSVPVVGTAEWAVVDRADPWVVADGSPILTNDEDRVRSFAAELSTNPDWTVVLDEAGVLVVARRP